MAINTKTGYGRAAIVVLKYPELSVIEKQVHEQPLTMPYIPGLLSFRELPCMLNAYAQVQQKPDLIFVDGMGIAHPRRLGIACHLGLWLNTPTIGCGKSRLVGKYDAVKLSEHAGSWTRLTDKNETIGAVVRTKKGVKPLFISPGHLIDLPTCIQYVMAVAGKHRLPVPIYLANKLSKVPRSNNKLEISL